MAAEEVHPSHDVLPKFELAILLICVGLAIGASMRWFQKKFHINVPYTVSVLVMGIILKNIPSSALGNLGDAIDEAAHINPHLLLGAFIPALIFESAFSTNYHIIEREFTQALLLAGPGVVVMVSVTAVFCRYVFPYDWSWSESFAFGAIVSATDPVAVVALLRELGASKRLATLIEGESLLNDGTAFVLYTIALAFVKGHDPDVGSVALTFVKLTFGGVLIGIVFGAAAAFWLSHVFEDPKVEISISLFVTYLAFHVSEIEIHASGILSCVFLGLVLSKYKSTVSPSIEQSMHHVWEIFSNSANTIIFLVSGIIIVDGFNSRDGSPGWIDTGYTILQYIFLHIARALCLAMLWWPMSHLGYGLSINEAIVLSMGGLRGVIGLALALVTTESVLDSEHEEQYKELVMFHTSGIVFLTLVINATLMKYVIRYLKMDLQKPQSLEILKSAMNHLRDETRSEMRSLKDIYFYAGADWREVVKSLPSYASMLSSIATDVDEEITFSSSDTYTDDNVGVKRRVKRMTTVVADGWKTMFQTMYSRPNASVSILSQDTTDSQTDDNVPNAGSHRGSDRTLRGKFDMSSMQDLRFGIKKKREVKSMLLPSTTILQRTRTSLVADPIKELEEVAARNTDDISDGLRPSLVTSLTQFMDGVGELDMKVDSSMTILQSHPTATNGIKHALNRTKSIIEQREQISHRILSVMKQAYRQAFEEGSISQYAEMILTEACEIALDEDDIGELYKKVAEVFSIPRWLKKWYESGILARFSRFFLFERLVVAVEVGTVFMSSTRTVNDVLNAVSQISQSPMCIEIIELLSKHTKHIREEVLSIQRSFPEIYRAIQTRNAAQHLCKHEEKKIIALAHEGLIEKEEEAKMMAKVKESQYALINKSFWNITGSNPKKEAKSYLRSLDFMSKLSDKELYKKVLHSEKRIIERGEYVYRRGDLPNGAVVLVRGAAQLFLDDACRDTYAPGNFLVWETLTDCPRLGDLKAHSTLEFFLIDPTLMKTIIDDDEVAEAIWQNCATNLILTHFRDFFRTFSRIEISKMCHLATMSTIEQEETKSLSAHTLLIKGNATYSASNVQSFTAPLVLLPSKLNYTFEEGSVLLHFYIDPRKHQAGHFSHNNRGTDSIIQQSLSHFTDFDFTDGVPSQLESARTQSHFHHPSKQVDALPPILSAWEAESLSNLGHDDEGTDKSDGAYDTIPSIIDNPIKEKSFAFLRMLQKNMISGTELLAMHSLEHFIVQPRVSAVSPPTRPHNKSLGSVREDSVSTIDAGTEDEKEPPLSVPKSKSSNNVDEIEEEPHFGVDN